MPRTSSPWSKALEALGRFGSHRAEPGQPRLGGEEFDVQGDLGWRSYLHSDKLWEAWSPSADSPWRPYAKPVLFAALDALPRRPDVSAGLGPRSVPGLDLNAALTTPKPPRRGNAVLLDLDGPHSVAYAAWLARAGYEPVPLFNNWPHPKGLVDVDVVLGALLHYVAWVADKQGRERDAPPVFLTDRRRLGLRPGMPLEFDNRYFHLEGDLPSAAVLRRHGIDRLVYVRPEGVAAPVEVDDMNQILHGMAKGGLAIAASEADPATWQLHPPAAWAPALRKTSFSTTRDPRFASFRRASAGGFGRIVPQPSSGGG